MKKMKVESKKPLKAANRRRVAGVQVRSGVKAGDFGSGIHEFGGAGGLGDSRLL